MGFHFGATRERFRALIAFERLIAHVTTDVELELAICEEPSIAAIHRAKVSLHTGVKFLVSIQIGFQCHSHAAYFAAIRFQLGLSEQRHHMASVHVSDQCVPSIGAVTTNIARQCLLFLQQQTGESTVLGFGGVNRCGSPSYPLSYFRAFRRSIWFGTPSFIHSLIVFGSWLLVVVRRDWLEFEFEFVCGRRLESHLKKRTKNKCNLFLCYF